jgi:hypothetical protein
MHRRTKVKFKEVIKQFTITLTVIVTATVNLTITVTVTIAVKVVPLLQQFCNSRVMFTQHSGYVTVI